MYSIICLMIVIMYTISVFNVFLTKPIYFQKSKNSYKIMLEILWKVKGENNLWFLFCHQHQGCRAATVQGCSLGFFEKLLNACYIAQFFYNIAVCQIYFKITCPYQHQVCCTTAAVQGCSLEFDLLCSVQSRQLPEF